MKKQFIIKSNKSFNDIINGGKKKSNEYFTIFYSDNNLNKSMFGISVAKKTGNAVIRNKLKRQVRAIIDASNFMFQKSLNYIIIIKKSCLGKTFENIKVNFQSIIGEINEE